MIQLKGLDTEQVNPLTAHIDQEDTQGILRLINQEDRRVAGAVAQEIPHIAQAVDAIYEKLAAGGRLIYIGAGTSGRLGVLDASECPPTYGVPYGMVQGVIAGGETALTHAIEGAEDHPEEGERDLRAIGFSGADVLVGIAASGRTPYVLGAMEYAKKLGAPVIGVSCCPGSQVDEAADIGIAPTPGPEVVTGSTRMKSGTAQKMILNMLSTGAMIRLGKVYGNLMVDVKPTNEKLVRRCVTIVCEATGEPEGKAVQALESCDYHCKTAIVMLLCGKTADEARALLNRADGRVAEALRLKD